MVKLTLKNVIVKLLFITFIIFSSCSNDNRIISPQLLSFEATALFKFDSNGDNERDSFVTEESTFKN